eukprot:jgi/Ulvmu1/10520/UM064_0058.1
MRDVMPPKMPALRNCACLRRYISQRSTRASAVDASLNSLVASVKPSKTMALTDLASSLKEDGIDVISLSVGQPDFPTPTAVSDAAKAAIDAGHTKYTPNAGTSSLRAAICDKLLNDNGLTYAPNEIVVTNGAKQAIWQAVLATVSPGDEVIVPAPYWVSYPEMVRMAGGTPVIIETTTDNNFCVSAQQLAAALTPRTRMLILCTPSNPAGTVYSRQQLMALADVVRGHPRCLVIADEIYELIMYPPHEHVSFAGLPDMWERTFTVNGVSKAFAMTGWRIGYLAAPTVFARAAAIIQSQSTSGACSVSQAAAEAALALGPAGGEPVREMVAAFEQRRDFVMQRLRAIGGLTIAQPQGAFYVLPDMSAYFGAGVSAEGFGEIANADALARYLLEVARVALVPGDAFGVPQCIRFSYAASMETLDEALSRVEQALEQLHIER